MNVRASFLPVYFNRPYVIDLFCGAGGCSMGYYMAGFNVLGVDNCPQPNYPFAFVQADAMSYPLNGFAGVHSSPPCQGYSVTKNGHSRKHPLLIEPVRHRLQDSGLPYVIENVQGAPLIDPVRLCGTMFELRVYRHRLFETNFPIPQPFHPPHVALCSNGDSFKGNRKPSDAHFYTVVGNFGHLEDARNAMGITWMRRAELAQAIPPAYTRFIGDFLLRHIAER